MRLKSSTPLKVSDFFACFTSLWAVAGIFHYFSILGVFTPASSHYVLSLLVFVAAVFLILKPKSLAVLNTYCFLQVVEVLYMMPEVPNHWLLTFFVNCTILASYIYRSEDREAKLFAAIRLELIIVYIFAFFHKLNFDFFNLEHSCAANFYRQAAVWFKFLPTSDAFLKAVIYGTLATECLIVVLLSTKRFRKFAILLGLFLHFGFTLTIEKHFYNFSAPMFVLLLSFLTEESFLRVRDHYGARCLRLIRALLMTFMLVVFALGFLILKVSIYHYYILAVNGLWFACSAFIIFTFLCLYRDLSAVRFKFYFSELYVFVFLVFLNGISPYLGIKTRTAWQMYSNLWVSHQGSNHFVVSRSLDVFGYLKYGDKRRDSEIEKKLTIFSKWEREAAKECVW